MGVYGILKPIEKNNIKEKYLIDVLRKRIMCKNYGIAATHFKMKIPIYGSALSSVCFFQRGHIP